MKKKSFQIFVLATIFLILDISAYGQLSSRDSLIIKKFEAVKISDSINSKVPPKIRFLVMEFLLKRGLNPNEYYTLGIFDQKIGEALSDDKKYERIGYLNLLRINALRDLSDVLTHVGASGGEGDDIQILFDTGYTKVIRMTPSE